MPGMTDDYLWYRSGRPDPDIVRLEKTLGRLRSAAPVPELPEAPPAEARWRRYAPLLAAAAAIALMIGVAWRTTRRAEAWTVAAVAGQPRIGAAAVSDHGHIAVGQTLLTDSASQARIDVASIGAVTIDPDSRVRLVATRSGHHQLALDYGTLHAVISAPPGQFVVSTPSATATDLGCAYTLHVDEDGTGLLSGTAGWVALTLNGRESLVPAGASSRTHPTLGPGTLVRAESAWRWLVTPVGTRRSSIPGPCKLNGRWAIPRKPAWLPGITHSRPLRWGMLT